MKVSPRQEVRGGGEGKERDGIPCGALQRKFLEGGISGGDGGGDGEENNQGEYLSWWLRVTSYE